MEVPSTEVIRDKRGLLGTPDISKVKWNPDSLEVIWDSLLGHWGHFERCPTKKNDNFFTLI